MKKLFFLTFLTLSVGLAYSQSQKMGDLSPEEIAYNEVAYEPGSSAVMLVATADSKFFSQIFETLHFRRIKILTEAGKEYADIKIRYFRGDRGVEEIYGEKAQIINIVDGKQVITKLGKENIFDVDLGDGYREKRFVFPDAQVGSILEYSYRKADKNLEFLDGWTFQNSMPTLYSKYQVTMIPQLEYKTIGQGSNFFTKAERESNNGTYAWTLRNLYSLKEEPFMKNYRDYLDRVEFQLYRYQVAATTSGAEWKDFLSTWEKLGDEMIEYYSMKGFYRTNPIEKDALSADLSGENETEKAKKAYYYIRDNFANEGVDWIYTNQTLPQLLKSKQGSPGELILAYMGLLKSMGISCEPVLIGSKGYGRSSIVPYPFLNQFDEILLLATLDGKPQLLDLSDPLAPFGYVDLDKHVSGGLLLKKNQSQLINLAVKHNSSEMIFSDVVLDSQSGELQMNYNVRSSYYEGLDQFHRVDNLKKAEKPLAEMFDVEEMEMELRNVEVENLLEEKNYLNTKFQLVMAGATEQEMLVFNPFKFSSFSKNPFTQDFRVFPVDFGYSFQQSLVANIHIPEGYEMEDYPTDEVLTIDGAPLIFTFKTEQIGQLFKVNAKIEVRQPLISSEQYVDLKFLMESIANKLNTPVIMKKTARP
ncbi:DUF3857 domain-containing protein [Algoriphagus taiwanensis]|uniref:DUF3857 domain-containing protein n=1 Tax=Algoriphagus taiwanensis TaxID=1445656 RepID=A0ABQ6Q602_9BACT|nr:hypothetical protein Ataiwa_38850 [Algoriphagus taiwanensis]